MRKKRFEFEECVAHCGFDNLPEGLSRYFDLYEEKEQSYLIGKVFLQDIFDRYHIPPHKQSLMLSVIEEMEQDTILFYFTKFLVWDMCSARNRCDIDNYTNMIPVCMKEDKEFYSLLLLFACVEPSMQLLKERGIPLEYYQKIPYQPMEAQLEKWVDKNDVTVSDFPWDMNFYTCAIFLMDRFLFIPYKFGDNLTMFRNRRTNKVIALRHADEEFRRDGQVNGINKVFDETGKFTSVWIEEPDFVTANPISPMGYVQKETVTIHKEDWDTALEPGDTLLALHVPSGPGYTPERLRSSMMLALEFYQKYFPELPIKGFWSESWLYDSRLSLILDNEKSNIIKVQRQFYLYPINEGDDMLRYEAFGDWKADPKDVELTTTLQKAAAAYMQTGARFNSLSMVVLKEEADKMGSMPYTTTEDIERFKRIVDSHLKDK
jgi:hypothetical protein